MGYFSNGSEGESYELALCSNCAHFDGCTVWFLHLMHNYQECNNPDSMLHVLIPRSEDGPGNEKCTMFIDKASAEEINRARTAYGKQHTKVNHALANLDHARKALLETEDIDEAIKQIDTAMYELAFSETPDRASQSEEG